MFLRNFIPIPPTAAMFSSFRLLHTRLTGSARVRVEIMPTRLINQPSTLVMTTDQVRDYLEKQLFIENTVVRGPKSRGKTCLRTLYPCYRSHIGF